MTNRGDRQVKKQQEYSMLSAAKRKMEVLVNHRTVASHPTWVRKGLQSDREAENQRKKKI